MVRRYNNDKIMSELSIDMLVEDESSDDSSCMPKKKIDVEIEVKNPPKRISTSNIKRFSSMDTGYN